MKTAEDILKESYPELYEDKTTFLTAFKMYISAMEEYANQSKWISVEDRLPEIGERALVIGWSSTDYRYSSSVYNNDSEPEQYIVVWDGKNSTTVAAIDDGAFCGNYQYICIDNITHWQPLPEKP